MEITIDGKTCEAAPGQFLMEVARANGFEIPSLCHHEGLSGQACCRLCIVEVEKTSGQAGHVGGPGESGQSGKREVVVSCVYPVKENIIVYTRSEKIVRLRRSILALLKARAPEAEGDLAGYLDEYGVAGYDSRFSKDGEKCILCGLCVKACSELGSAAIGTAGRGAEKMVSTPFDELSEDCLGCLACARVCPANAISFSDGEITRIVWGRTFILEKCAVCGRHYATAEELEWLKTRLVDADLNLDHCPDCRAKGSIS